MRLKKLLPSVLRLLKAAAPGAIAGRPDAGEISHGDGKNHGRSDGPPLQGPRSPWWLRYGWAITVSGLLVGQLLLDCTTPLSEPVRLLLEGAGLDRVSCPGDDSGRQQQQAEPAPR